MRNAGSTNLACTCTAVESSMLKTTAKCTQLSGHSVHPCMLCSTTVLAWIAMPRQLQASTPLLVQQTRAQTAEIIHCSSSSYHCRRLHRAELPSDSSTHMSCYCPVGNTSRPHCLTAKPGKVSGRILHCQAQHKVAPPLPGMVD
jgi:hypothetical protein